MTSQAWLTTNEVDRPVWKHWMIIVRPDDVASHPKSLLFIGGGANDGKPPTRPTATWSGSPSPPNPWWPN